MIRHVALPCSINRVYICLYIRTSINIYTRYTYVYTLIYIYTYNSLIIKHAMLRCSMTRFYIDLCICTNTNIYTHVYKLTHIYIYNSLIIEHVMLPGISIRRTPKARFCPCVYVCVCARVGKCMCVCVYAFASTCVCAYAKFASDKIFSDKYYSGEVGGWGRDPKKCTGRVWGRGSSAI